MEGHRHYPVSEVEGFLNPVTMVDVNINVQHPRVVPGVTAELGPEAEVNPKKKTPNSCLPNTRSGVLKSLLWPSHLKPNTTSSLRATLGLQPGGRDRRGMCREGASASTQQGVCSRAQEEVARVKHQEPGRS